jgi:hypothetical protein
VGGYFGTFILVFFEYWGFTILDLMLKQRSKVASFDTTTILLMTLLIMTILIPLNVGDITYNDISCD